MTWRYQIRRDDTGTVIDFTSPGGEIETMTLAVVRAAGRSQRDFLVPHDVVLAALDRLRTVSGWPVTEGREEVLG